MDTNNKVRDYSNFTPEQLKRILDGCIVFLGQIRLRVDDEEPREAINIVRSNLSNASEYVQSELISKPQIELIEVSKEEVPDNGGDREPEPESAPVDTDAGAVYSDDCAE